MILLFLPKRSKGGKSSGLVSPTKSRKDEIINGGLGYPSPTTLSRSELGSQQRGSGLSSPRPPPLSSHPGRKPVLGPVQAPGEAVDLMPGTIIPVFMEMCPGCKAQGWGWIIGSPLMLWLYRSPLSDCVSKDAANFL